MKLGKLLISTLVVAVIMFLTDWLWYGMLMKDSMTPLPNARPEMGFPWMILGMLIYGFAFCYIFAQGRGSGSAMGEGARFGFWAALLAWIPMGFVWYGLVSTMPLSEYLMNDVFRVVQMMILGVVAAYTMGMQGDRGKSATGGDG